MSRTTVARRIPWCSGSIRTLLLVALALVAGGCVRSTKTETAAKDDDVPVFKKKTQDIAKFDPAAGREVSDSKINATTPGLAAAQALGPMLEKTSIMGIDVHVANYYAEHGKWPNYEEFMSEVIKKNSVELPVLPAKMEYQYDETQHKLVVVHPLKPQDEKAGEKK